MITQNRERGKIKVLDILSDRFPGLVENIRSTIAASERAFDGRPDSGSHSYLWEHTVLVVEIAFRIAEEEGLDPLAAAAAALFHDAGKFVEGRYHENNEPEEEAAAGLAETMLPASGASPSLTRRVAKAVRDLYNPRGRRNRLASAVHDADFLAKAGLVGVAGFFIKSTLRGRGFEDAIVHSLSRELTYAACLPSNMRTRAGRHLAEKKSSAALVFYRRLLTELGEIHGRRFRIRKIRIPKPGTQGATLEIRLVLPAVCGVCGRSWRIAWDTESGIKCEKLTAEIRCAACGERLSVSFCLPEIPA
jgi:HD superfamily phosphodiesterase